MLLKYSASVLEFCTICGKFEDPKNIITWVKCDICQRWIHEQCDSRKHDISVPIESSNVFYVCPICSINFDVHTHLTKPTESPTKMFGNGLFQDINYYRYSKKSLSNYVVAIYDYTYDLTIEDYMTLNACQYISNTLFHTCSNIFLNCTNRTDIKIWSIFKTCLMFYNLKSLEYTFFKDEFFQDKLLHHVNIIPILNNSHFTLIIIVFKNFTFQYIDPMGTEFSIVADMFKRFAKELNFDTANIKIINVDHCVQKDGYNCGIYVLHFIQCTINNLDLTSPNNPDQERDRLKKILLEKSKDVKEYCLKCGRKVTEADKCFQCHKCKKFIEKGCLITDICPLCKIYTEKKG
ncbi:unnamed protein product [Psylliodes chrysocephalus]|uniref:PHD-type domain-containing protein n=1 Tax=Psylliodes chrysocephalus TaxID=3402493 RepID=A0A9P0CVC5_9CUCU|nr:unnamed protein product [Psylliodes chrysocephala]